MRSSTTSSSLTTTAPNRPVVALFGPTAAGKSAVAGAILAALDGELVSADSAALYEGLPVLTAAPAGPARLVGIVPLADEVSVGEYQRLAHAAVDEILAAGMTPVVAGGTGLYFRAAISAFELPPPPAPGERERWSAVYDETGPEAAHALLAERDPAAAARVHANDRRRVVRALELAAAGSSLAPPEDRLWADDVRRPTVIVGLDLPPAELDARIAARVAEMVEHGVVAEAQAAWKQPLSATTRKVLGLEEFATLPLTDAVEAVVLATRRLARYQRKWLRRLRSPLPSPPTDPWRRSQLRSSRWQAEGNVYLVAEEALDAARVVAEVGDADGILEVRARGEDWLEIAIWNPDGSLAEMSGNGTRIAARWLAELTGARSVAVKVGPREVKAQMLDGDLVEQDLGPVAVGEPETIDGIRFTPVDVGNPHAVVEGDPAELDHAGPLLERHPRFPNRTNVQVARRLGPDLIEARVWERGVGETAASGTSAIAIVAALGGGSAIVRFPGGELAVSVEGGRARLTGHAARSEPGESLS